MDIVLWRCALLRLETGEIEPDRCVRIEGDRIVEVGGPDLRSGAAGELDCGGRTLMPGLIDAHVHQNEEFAIRSRVLPPLEILRSATLVNAEILNRSGELGCIAPGALADLLIVDGNPLENLLLLVEPEKNLALIMKAGEPIVNHLA